MSVTIKNLLSLPCLREAVVLGGHKGLMKTVGAVSVLEYSTPDDQQDYLIKAHDFFCNELVISCFADIKDNSNAQCRTLKRLVEIGEIGLILYYVGIILPKVDKRLIELADSLDFPLISMPENRPNLRYSEVISEVMGAIIKDQMSHSNFQAEIIERISSLPVKLPELVQAIMRDEPYKMRHIAAIFKIDVASIHNMWIITPINNDTGTTNSEKDNQNLLSLIRGELSPYCKTIVADIYNQDIVAFMDNPVELEMMSLADALFNSMEELKYKSVITVFLNLKDTTQVRQGYLRYKSAIAAARYIYPHKNIFNFQEISFAEKCQNIITQGEECIKQSMSILDFLEDDNSTQINEAIETVSAFLLDAENSLDKCTRFIFLHRNSIKYRINQINERLGFKLGHMPETMEIYTAVAVRRILESGFKPE